MREFSKTWWGKKFIEALEGFTNPARLGRGRSYAKNGKIKEYKINQGKITAKVRGSVNPYFGVYKEPLYTTTIEIEPISAADWSKAIAYLGSKASMISKLLLDEVPDNIESAFSELNLHLLPQSQKDFKTKCSCPDWENPCKHIAGVYYLVASELDQNPFLLFELRGISRAKLQEELAKSPLGKILSEAMDGEEVPLEPFNSYYTRPEKVKASETVNWRQFWLGEHRLPQNATTSAQEVGVAAIVVKKGGDFPAFWSQDSSFLEVMEEFYQRVRAKNASNL
jgi:uncharacterized Zn finger protein